MNVSTPWCYQFVPELVELRKARQPLSEHLVAVQLTANQQHAILIGMTEWVTNIIKYATVKPKLIQLICTATSQAFTLTVRDDGSFFVDMSYYMQKAIDLHLIEELSEGGYGLMLIRQLFPHCRYQQVKDNDNNYNELLLSVHNQVAMEKTLIAVIDDSIAICELVQQYLQDEYHVVTFADAASFLAALPQMKIDLIISDILMPGINGLELRALLSQSPTTDIIPFVFLTVSEDSDIETQANELGIDDFIHKPIRQQQLQRIIKRVLTRKKNERQVIGDMLDAKITQALRPQLPAQLNDYHCAMISRQASAGGGDFIVHLQYPDKQLIILGDVMGHGLGAKFFAHIYAGYIQGLIYSLHHENHIAGILQGLSLLIDQDPYLESVIITCVGLSLEANNQIWIANAGHPPPLLLTDQGVQEIHIPGSLPGLMAGAHYEAHGVNITHGRLLIYTDGLLEIGKKAAEREQAKQSLYTLLQTTATAPLAELKTQLSQHIDTMTHLAPEDDITAVILE